MGLKPVLLALQAKGPIDVSKRMWAIASRYGVSSSKMLGHLESLFEIVENEGARATLPVTASAAARHPRLIRDLGDRGIEFAVHGYHHVDHRALSKEEQLAAFHKGRQTLEDAGVKSTGFRAPYLRWSSETLAAVAASGFEYDSSQAFHWQVSGLTPNESYARVLEFCHSLPAAPRAMRPWTEDGVLRIPYSLPDDEALVDRLKISDPEAIAEIWLGVWRHAHDRGDLFALGIHPERIGICGTGVESVLRAARSADDEVWVATLDEISRWWRARSQTVIEISRLENGEIEISTTSAPDGAHLLARGLQLDGNSNWRPGFVHLDGSNHTVRSEVRPVVGIDPSAPASLAEFVIEEGFAVEPSSDGRDVAVHLSRDRFSREDGQNVISEILDSGGPLVRLARWPRGARSALAITGDVDAFTLRDYASRLTRQ